MSAAPADPGPARAEVPEVKAVQAVLRLSLLMRTITLHGPTHPLAMKVAEQLREAIHAAEPPFKLQFVSPAVFRNCQLLPMDLDAYLQGADLAKALDNLDAQELQFDHAPPSASLLQLGIALSRAQNGPTPMLEERGIEGMDWRSIPKNVTLESVDPEVFVQTQMTLALSEGDGISIDPLEPWDWSRGMGVMRRLDRVVGTDALRAIRVIEMTPGAWTVRRRAVSAALDVMLVLNSLRVSPSVRRAGCHAALILAMRGLDPKGGKMIVDAAKAVLPRMLEAKSARMGQQSEPHRLRVTVIVNQVAKNEWTDDLMVLRLVEIAYEMARMRCPPDLAFHLNRIDVLAQAAAEAGRTLDANWTGEVVKQIGVVPPGSFVRLADGKMGIVFEPSADPWKPKVLVDGKVVQVDQPVTPFSPAALLASRG